MATDVYNGSIEQAIIQTWQNNFIVIAQEKNSILGQSKAVEDFSFNGNRHNITRMGSLELNEITGRNPDKVYDELFTDNRQVVKRQFTKSLIFDNKDIREMMADPTSTAYELINNAYNREKDRFIAEAALASVQVGDPNSGTPLETLSAADDGVVTINATAGLTYDKMVEIKRRFINASVVDPNMMDNSLTFFCSGSDWEQLVKEEKFINGDYSGIKPIDRGGYMPNIFGFNTGILAGSKAGQEQVSNPILKETATIRNCLALAEKSIKFSTSNLMFKYESEVPGKIRSSAITFYVEMAAIRTEGERVINVQTTF